MARQVSRTGAAAGAAILLAVGLYAGGTITSAAPRSVRILGVEEMAATLGDAGPTGGPNLAAKECKCTIECRNGMLQVVDGATYCYQCGWLGGDPQPTRFVCWTTTAPGEFNCNPDGGGAACSTKIIRWSTSWDTQEGTCDTRSCTGWTTDNTTCGQYGIKNASGVDCPQG